MKKLLVEVPDELHTWIKKEAADQSKTMGQITIFMLDRGKKNLEEIRRHAAFESIIIHCGLTPHKIADRLDITIEQLQPYLDGTKIVSEQALALMRERLPAAVAGGVTDPEPVEVF